MKAYNLAMALIIFYSSITIASALGFSSFMSPTNVQQSVQQGTGLTLGYNASDISAIFLTAGGVVAAIVGVALRVPVGATVFAVVFGFGNLGLSSTLTNFVNVGYLLPEVSAAMQIIILFVFIFGYAQMASVGGKVNQ